MTFLKKADKVAKRFGVKRIAVRPFPMSGREFIKGAQRIREVTGQETG